MRIVGSIVAVCLWAAPALANPDTPHTATASGAVEKAAAADAAATAGKPAEATPRKADRRLPDEYGQLRSVDVAAPAPSKVESGPRTSRDREVVAPYIADAPAVSPEVTAELAARQLAKETRRHQREIDACVAAAQRRHPATVGTMTFTLTITNRALATVALSDDTVHDFDLAACLARTAHTFKFALSSAQIAWPVTLTPTAAR